MEERRNLLQFTHPILLAELSVPGFIEGTYREFIQQPAW